MMLVTLGGNGGLYVITKGMVSVRLVIVFLSGVRPENVRGPLYLGFEEVSVVTTVNYSWQFVSSFVLCKYASLLEQIKCGVVGGPSCKGWSVWPC